MATKRKPNALEWLQEQLRWRAAASKNESMRNDYLYLKGLAEDAEGEIENMILDAQMYGIRNPAYDGDWVGWLDDDFDDDDDYGCGKGKKK